jgi:hypothetical protein
MCSFVLLRGSSLLLTAGDPPNHTKNHEKQDCSLSLVEQADMLVRCAGSLEALH